LKGHPKVGIAQTQRPTDRRTTQHYFGLRQEEEGVLGANSISQLVSAVRTRPPDTRVEKQGSGLSSFEWLVWALPRGSDVNHPPRYLLLSPTTTQEALLLLLVLLLFPSFFFSLSSGFNKTKPSLLSTVASQGFVFAAIYDHNNLLEQGLSSSSFSPAKVKIPSSPSNPVI
jgi:hypothetical protein